jgi:REP-associated tyrosine transposase
LDPKIHHRHSTRLKGYDYSQAGAYFIAAVTWQRENLFGEIVGGDMRLNAFGQIVQTEWARTPDIRHEIELGAFVVMPNHFHAIVIIHGLVGADGRPPLPYRLPRPLHGQTPKSLGSLMAGFKSSVTKQINVLRNTPAAPVWQRNYHDHIIRNDREMSRIWNYIEANPSRWEDDVENPAHP